MVAFFNGWKKKTDTVKYRNVSHGDTALLQRCKYQCFIARIQMYTQLFVYLQNENSWQQLALYRCVVLRFLRVSHRENGDGNAGEKKVFTHIFDVCDKEQM